MYEAYTALVSLVVWQFFVMDYGDGPVKLEFTLLFSLSFTYWCPRGTCLKPGAQNVC